MAGTRDIVDERASSSASSSASAGRTAMAQPGPHDVGAEPPSPRTLPRWDDLPDFDLYMDQVVSLMERYLGAPAEGEKGLTASMVNNYVKIGAVPAPSKKKYARIHLACLVVVTVLKPVLSLAALQEIIADVMRGDDPAAQYDRFCERFEEAERQPFADRGAAGAVQSRDAVVAAALSAQAYRHVARQLYAMRNPADGHAERQGGD